MCDTVRYDFCGVFLVGFQMSIFLLGRSSYPEKNLPTFSLQYKPHSQGLGRQGGRKCWLNCLIHHSSVPDFLLCLLYWRLEMLSVPFLGRFLVERWVYCLLFMEPFITLLFPASVHTRIFKQYRMTSAPEPHFYDWLLVMISFCAPCSIIVQFC